VETNGKAAAGVLEALGDPTRRAIFELLAAGPRAVGELADQLPVSRPAVSQHLKVLKEAGLVVDQPAGTRRLYRVNAAGVGALRSWLDRMWSSALVAFKAVAEQTEQTEQTELTEEEP
jgi:DNA-binding transcriptional ArsR family regulator